MTTGDFYLYSLNKQEPSSRSVTLELCNSVGSVEGTVTYSPAEVQVTISAAVTPNCESQFFKDRRQRYSREQREIIL